MNIYDNAFVALSRTVCMGNSSKPECTHNPRMNCSNKIWAFANCGRGMIVLFLYLDDYVGAFAVAGANVDPACR
jgi:hypothetical protein